MQCKHFAGSSFSALRAAARKEAARLTANKARFASYTFVASQPLTALRKTRLAQELSPWIASDSDVIGAHDLESLLDRHPEVERRQVKLWLTGGTQLAALLRAGTIHRSRSLLEDIQRSLPSYVQGQAFDEARPRLRDQRVLVIAGVPGIGKTTLARILMADAVLDGYEPIEVSHDIEEGWEMLDDSTKQIFLYDDFLGRAALAGTVREERGPPTAGLHGPGRPAFLGAVRPHNPRVHPAPSRNAVRAHRAVGRG